MKAAFQIVWNVIGLVAVGIVAIVITVRADTNVLQLTWAQPPGYSSTLYTATNVGGTWTPLATNVNPFSVQTTQSVAFFYVTVVPDNNLAGGCAPTNNAKAGATYLNTNTGDIYFNFNGGTNGWVWEIAG